VKGRPLQEFESTFRRKGKKKDKQNESPVRTGLKGKGDGRLKKAETPWGQVQKHATRFKERKKKWDHRRLSGEGFAHLP